MPLVRPIVRMAGRIMLSPFCRLPIRPTGPGRVTAAGRFDLPLAHGPQAVDQKIVKQRLERLPRRLGGEAELLHDDGAEHLLCSAPDHERLERQLDAALYRHRQPSLFGGDE